MHRAYTSMVLLKLFNLLNLLKLIPVYVFEMGGDDGLQQLRRIIIILLIHRYHRQINREILDFKLSFLHVWDRNSLIPAQPDETDSHDQHDQAVKEYNQDRSLFPSNGPIIHLNSKTLALRNCIYLRRPIVCVALVPSLDLILTSFREHCLIVNIHRTYLFTKAILFKLLLNIVFSLDIVHCAYGASINGGDWLLDAQACACFVLESQAKMIQIR